MLEVVDLSCARGDRTLFRGLAFSIKPGELLHVAGPNGSGKTTLLRTLSGLTRPLDGIVRWNGNNTLTLGDDYRSQISYVGHSNGIQGELTPAENLHYSAALGEKPVAVRVDAALMRVGLDAYSDFPAKILSQGQKRRLALARLLVNERPLWVLDEPLSALDSASITLMMHIISEQLARDGLVVLTSHQALEVGELKQRTLVLNTP